jgi:hypothetical protein
MKTMQEAASIKDKEALLAHGHQGDVQLFILDTKLNENPLMRPVMRVNQKGTAKILLDDDPLELSVSPSFLGYVASQREGRVAIISVLDASGFQSALKRNLKQNLALSIAREQELTTAPIQGMKPQSHHQKIGILPDTIDLDIAIQKHWIHLLTGLVLNKADQAMLIQGLRPMWSNGLIDSVKVRKFDIKP